MFTTEAYLQLVVPNAADKPRGNRVDDASGDTPGTLLPQPSSAVTANDGAPTPYVFD